ncbi:MAG: hypothetical protein OEZ02_08965 [Anaerolineae bacterium]|nr:hypothetical protein [Anaerolineae bacterium]
MHYRQLFKSAWLILRGRPLMWAFGALVVIGELLQSFNPQYVLLKCLFLLAALVWLLGEAGLIAGAHTLQANPQASLAGSWGQSKTHFTRLFAVYLLTGILAISLVGLAAKVFAAPGESAWASSLRSLGLDFILLLLVTLAQFAFRAVVIHRLDSLASLGHAVLVVSNNLFRILSLTAVFGLLHLLFTGLPVLLWLAIRSGVSLQELLPLAVRAYAPLSSLPAIQALTLAASLFLAPYKSIVFTLAYLHFTQQVAYPPLDADSGTPTL